jgi:hypothetical protein
VKYLLLLILFLFVRVSLHAQSIETEHKTEFWAAYIFPMRISERFSIWNDVHVVPNSFFIDRHGLSYHINSNNAVTLGYAWLKTATPFSERLIRFEHRPWGQWETLMKMSHRMDFRFRIRYDLRIRKGLEESTISEDFLHYSRLRFMNGIRFPVFKLKKERPITLNLMNETLLNFGSEISGNNLDQNRLWVLFGYRYKNFSIMPGYEWRFVPSTQKNNNYHGAAIWLVHEISFLNKP